MPELSQNAHRGRPERLLRWVVLLCLLLLVAIAVAVLRPQPGRGKSNLARTPYSHSVERVSRLADDGEWMLESETEQWQLGGDRWPEARQWQSTKRADTGAVTYWYWGGGQNRNLTFSTATGKLTEGPASPIFHHWDWEHMLNQKQTFGTLERQADSTHRGRSARVYRLTTSDGVSETEQTFYIDATSGLTVREEGVLRLHAPEEPPSTEKLERDTDYGPFQPAELFDIHSLARQPEA